MIVIAFITVESTRGLITEPGQKWEVDEQRPKYTTNQAQVLIRYNYLTQLPRVLWARLAEMESSALTRI